MASKGPADKGLPDIILWMCWMTLTIGLTMFFGWIIYR